MPSVAGAQQIKYDPGFFKTQYYIGEQETTINGLLTHVKPRNVDAYLLLRKAKNQNTAAWVFTLVCIGGAAAVLTQAGKQALDRDHIVYVGGLSALGVGVGGSLLFSTLADLNFKSGVKSFNE